MPRCLQARPKRTVLVVEDDRRLRDLYRATLAEAGFSVLTVSDGVDALRALESNRLPSVVVLDLALPRLSGRDVGQELKATARTRHIPIIIVTGTDAKGAEGLDIECVLRKPFLPERLIEAVDIAMRKTV